MSGMFDQPKGSTMTARAAVAAPERSEDARTQSSTPEPSRTLLAPESDPARAIPVQSLPGVCADSPLFVDDPVGAGSGASVSRSLEWWREQMAAGRVGVRSGPPVASDPFDPHSDTTSAPSAPQDVPQRAQSLFPSLDRAGIWTVERTVLAMPPVVAFVMAHHDYDSDSCHPTAGDDCWAWCEACKVLAGLPLELVEAARQYAIAKELDRG